MNEEEMVTFHIETDGGVLFRWRNMPRTKAQELYELMRGVKVTNDELLSYGFTPELAYRQEELK